MSEMKTERRRRDARLETALEHTSRVRHVGLGAALAGECDGEHQPSLHAHRGLVATAARLVRNHWDMAVLGQDWEGGVMDGNAYKHAPARQAMLQREGQNPEFVRRQKLYRETKGFAAKMLVASWNVDWNVAGRPADFPDFPEWKAARAERRAALESKP